MVRKEILISKIRYIELFILLLLISSCVITQKTYLGNSNENLLDSNSNIAILLIDDYRDDLDKKHFPNADLYFQNILESDLINEFNDLLIINDRKITNESVNNDKKYNQEIRYCIYCRLYDYGWSAVTFSFQIIDLVDSNIVFSSVYQEHESQIIPTFLSAYNPNRQAYKAMKRLKKDLLKFLN